MKNEKLADDEKWAEAQKEIQPSLNKQMLLLKENKNGY